MRCLLVILLSALPIWGVPLDLSTEAPWELRLENGERYQVGQRLFTSFYTDGDPVATGSSSPMAGNTTDSSSREFSEIPGPNETLDRLGGSLEFWQGRLGKAYCQLCNDALRHTLYLYRATMADIGLQVEDGDVVGLILMEPGQLRTHFLRRDDYREI